MASFLLRLSLLTASATQVLASCAYGTHLQPRAEAGAVPINTFGYSGPIGPLNWVSLGPENVLCGTGTRQSPIDMIAGQFNMLPGGSINLNIPDFAEGTEFENLGTTVEVIAKGGTMSVGGVNYNLQQFHFHLPSEHLDNGTSLAMEMHMVWQGPNQEVAVIGVMIDLDPGAAAAAVPAAVPAAAPVAAKRGAKKMARREQAARELAEKRSVAAAPGAALPVASVPVAAVAPAAAVAPMALAPVLASAAVPSTLLETVLNSVDAIATPGTKVATQPLVMAELVQTLVAGSFQSYMGSLTTPPCSEGVQWLVSTQKLQIQTATFERVRSVIGFNSRFPQNLLGQPNLLQLASQAVAGAQIPMPLTIPAPP